MLNALNTKILLAILAVLPGFLNQKYDPAHRVTVEYPDDSVWTPSDFRLEVAATEATAFALAKQGRKPPRKHSNSESDWAWVSGQLRQGKDALKLTRELASRRSDKPNPVYYAQRTVDVASAYLWLRALKILPCWLRASSP